MICIRCQHDSKYPERKESGGKCPRCGGKFAFETRESARFSDKAFQSAIDTVSAKGKLRWGVEHLYYELCRRKRFGVDGRLVLFVVTVSLLCFFFVKSDLPFEHNVLIAAIVSFLAFLIGLMLRPKGHVTIPRGEFELMWDRWGQVHGKVPSAIQRKPHESLASREVRAVEPDLEDYSFDRAVICDRARTVDLLLANNFHFENNCAVLSIDGYPRQAFEGVRRMLKRNPRLEVYALHDATPEGCRLAQRLAEEPEWFRGQAHVIDVGLRPRHAGPFRGLLLPGDERVSAGEGISEQEAEWLSSNRLELAAIRPEQVLRRLFKAISRQPERPSLAPVAAVAGASTFVLAGAAAAEPKKKPRDNTSSSSGGGGDSSTDSGWSLDSDSFSSDASSSDGGSDSFG